MRKQLLSAAIALSVLCSLPAFAQPIVTDSRIKTFVYNENEVFNVTTHYGYQANVEFGAKEEIETVSVGDRVAWQIVPAGRRLFIRAMEENAHTNMTIITNKRAYQFDLRSSASDAVYGSEELTYVVRFFYTEEGGLPPSPIALLERQRVEPVMAAPAPQVFSQPIPAPAPQPIVQYTPPAPAPAPALNYTQPTVPQYTPPSYPTAAMQQPQTQRFAPLPSPTLLTQQPAPIAPPVTTITPPAAPLAAAAPTVNYRYTYTGPNDIAPVKIYDDGRSTYFKFRDMTRLPRVAIVNARGEEIEVPYQLNAEGMAVVNTIAPRFSLRNNGAEVLVYNEAQVAG